MKPDLFSFQFYRPDVGIGGKDLAQIFTEFKTYVILGFGLFCLAFIYFLAGMDDINRALAWGNKDFIFYVVGPSVGFLIGLILIVLGFHEFGEYNLIRNTPTSTIRSVPMGRVEVKGKTDSISEEHLLESPFTQEPCLGYECKIEKYEVEDDNDDFDDEDETETGSWETIYDNREAVPFILRDETGELVIDGLDAEWSLENLTYYEKFYEDSAPLSLQSFVEEHSREIFTDRYEDEGEFDLFWGDQLRFTEVRIDPEEDFYVLGGAKPLDQEMDLDLEDVENVITKDERTGFFYLSDKSEEAIVQAKFWGMFILLGLGVVITPGSAVALCKSFGLL